MSEETRSYIELKPHGLHQVELKSCYFLSDAAKDTYTLEFNLFIPASLSLDRENFGVKTFFSELQSMTRFGIAAIPLSRLVDPECLISPLTRIRQELNNANLARDLDEARILYELRSLSNIYKTQLSSTMELLQEQSESSGKVVIQKRTRELLKEIKTFLESYRKLNPLFLEPAVSRKLREAYSWADEALSLATSEILFKIYNSRYLIHYGGNQEEKIIALMQSEMDYRLSMSYELVLKEESSEALEKWIYRKSVLKKWSQSALYLSFEESRSNRSLTHLLAGFAAAIAMTFAVLTTIIADRLLPRESMAWAMLIVVAYIFKDRIKESIRTILVHTFPRLVSDKRIKLVDQATNRRVGRSRSMVRFLKAGEADAEVIQIRQAGFNPFREILPEEELIYFRKDSIIKSGQLNRTHMRLDNITDIIRIRLDKFFSGMDDPDKTITTMKDGQPLRMQGKRVYRFNLILGLSRKGEKIKTYQHYRLIMSKDGLERIENLL